MAFVGGKSKKDKKTKKDKKVKKTGSKKRPLNPYMLAKEKARKSGAKTFEYKGTTYYKMTMKTGMVAYTKNKAKANK
jgi:hypothetical protein